MAKMLHDGELNPSLHQPHVGLSTLQGTGGDLGTSVGLGEPTGIWGERQESLGISWHHPHPQKVRKPLLQSYASPALMNTLQKKLPGFCPVAFAFADSNHPSLKPPFLATQSSTSSFLLCLPGATTRGFTAWPRSWCCGGCWPSAAGSVTGGSAGSGRPSASPTSTASGKGSSVKAGTPVQTFQELKNYGEGETTAGM